MGFVNKNSPIPYYLQLADLLRDQILSDVYGSQTLLPSERELCDIHSVSRSTVRQAMQVLKDKGLIRKERGIGTRVENKEAIEQDLMGYHNFDLQMQENGHTASVQVLDYEILSQGGRVQRLMDLPVGSDIFKVIRLRIVDDEPVFIEKLYLPLEKFPDLKVDDFSRTDIFLNHLGSIYNIVLGDAKLFIEPVILDRMERDILEIKADPAVGMMFERISYDNKGRSIAVTKRVFSANRCRHMLTIKPQ